MAAKVADWRSRADRWSPLLVAVVLITVGAIGTRLAREDSFFTMELQLFEAGICRWYSPANSDPLPQALRLSPMIAATPAVLGGMPRFLLRDAARGRVASLELNQLITAAPGRVLYSLQLGRHLVLACWIAAVWLVWLVVRPYGPGPALATVAVCAFSPSFLSFGHLLSSDTLAAAAAIASCAAMAWYIEQPNTLRAGVAGGVMGCAIAVKLSLAPLLPAWILGLYATASRGRSEPRLPARLLLHSAVCLFFAWFVLAAIHRFSFGYDGPYHSDTFLRLFNGEGPLATIVRATLWLVPRDVLHGADVQLFFHDYYRQPVRVWGILFQSGTPLYYLGTAVVKEPTGFVLLLAVGLLGAFRLAVWPFSPKARRVVPFAGFSVLLWIVATGLPGFQDYRYVLPALACLAPCLAYVLSHARRPLRLLLYAATLIGSLEGLLAWPHYTAFVNVATEYLAGDGQRVVDPKTVYRAQDLFRLKRWLDAHPEASNPILAVATAEPPFALYGLPEPSETCDRTKEQENSAARGGGEAPMPVRPGWYAVERALVLGDFVRTGATAQLAGPPYLYEYLRDAQPVAEVGRTILVYRLTAEDCRELLRTVGYPRRAPGDGLP